MDTVYEPLRRWGSKTGVFCGWAMCEDGRKVLLSLSTAQSESYERCLGVLRDFAKRGMQVPVSWLRNQVDTLIPVLCESST